MIVTNWLWNFLQRRAFRRLSKDTIYFQKGETPYWHSKREVSNFLMDVQMGARSCNRGAEIIVKAFDDFEIAYQDLRKHCEAQGADTRMIYTGEGKARWMVDQNSVKGEK